jgi:uncharacterized RDD family membrane protein YckC
MNPPVRYAGFWLRFAAAVIDSVLVTAIIVPLLLAAYGRGYFRPFVDFHSNPDDLLVRLMTLADALDQPMYSAPANYLIQYLVPAVAIVLFWMARQATPGKMVLKMRIADAKTLGPPTRTQDVLRYLGYYVSMLGMFLGFLWVALDARKQGWHDKIARTVVIRVDS